MNAIKRVCFTKDFVKLASSRWPSLTQTYQRKMVNPGAQYDQLVVHLKSQFSFKLNRYHSKNFLDLVLLAKDRSL